MVEAYVDELVESGITFQHIIAAAVIFHGTIYRIGEIRDKINQREGDGSLARHQQTSAFVGKLYKTCHGTEALHERLLGDVRFNFAKHAPSTLTWHALHKDGTHNEVGRALLEQAGNRRGCVVGSQTGDELT